MHGVNVLPPESPQPSPNNNQPPVLPSRQPTHPPETSSFRKPPMPSPPRQQNQPQTSHEQQTNRLDHEVSDFKVP